MSVSTAAACLALPIRRLQSRHGLRRRISPCYSPKSGLFSDFSGRVASTRDRSSITVEAVSREEEATRSTPSGHKNHIISAFPMSLIASQLFPSETLAALTPEESITSSHILNNPLLMDLDPNTAKLAIGVIGPFLSAYGFLFIVRIVMSWYPKLPVGKFPYVLAYAPTEPVLVVTRKVIPPLGGVDVTPVVWFGLLSFLNEILVGPQGLLVLLSQQV